MNGHAVVCSRLLSVGLKPSSLDLDNYTPLMYAILNGSMNCASVLHIEGQADASPPTVANDLSSLSLACRVGHVGIVQLLLEHNVKSVPNTNGEYPIHIAAQEGHAEICRLLRNLEGWDSPDKYNEWTPVFHAARNGHAECVKVLLELGSRVGIVDETGKQAVFYAAWYGHPSCVELLLEATARSAGTGLSAGASPRIQSGAEDDDSTEASLDMIPTLSLPPPIMPYRVYGHNFLDNSFLVHVCIGHSFSSMSRKLVCMSVISSKYWSPSPLIQY